MKTDENEPNDIEARESGVRSIILPALISFSVALLLTMLTLVLEGPAMAARAATALVMPAGALWLLLLTGWLWLLRVGQRREASMAFLLWAFVFVGFNQTFAGWCVWQVEHKAGDAHVTPEQSFRAVIVLGGGASPNRLGTDELNCGGERVFSAAQLWHAKKTRAIICSDAPYEDRDNEDSVPLTLLKSVGVPEGAVIELEAHNTSGEMNEIKKLFQASPSILDSDGKVGLITSAFHMNRALRLARTHGLAKTDSGGLVEVVPLPCNYLSGGNRRFSPFDLIPSSGAGHLVSLAFKERLAWFVGR